MNRVWTLVKLDVKLAVRHKLVHVTVIIAALFGLLIAFVFPAQLEPQLGLVADPAAAAAAATPPTVLDPGAQKPPFNQLFIPILFAVDLSLLGFMFGAVMVLQDKQHGTIRFYRVGPGTSFDYVAAKLTVNLGLSLLNFLILVGLGAPRALAEPRLVLLVLTTCAGMILLGLGLATLFRNIAQFFFPIALVGLLGATPMYLVFTPAAGLAWTRWLPTYHVLFGAEAIMFDGDAAVIRTALLASFGFLVLAAGCCGVAVHTLLMREAH